MTRWMLDIPVRPFVNNSGEDIPQFACMFITGSQTEGHDSALLATKPDANAIKYDYSRFAFNVGKVVPAGGYGDAQLWYPALAVVDSSGVDEGVAVGPVSGSFKLSSASKNPRWYVSAEDPVHSYYSSSSVRTWFILPYAEPGAMFLTTSTITARSGSSSPWTAGTGTGTLCEFVVVSSTLKLQTTSVTSVDLVHMGSDTIASGRLVQCKRWQGRWLIDVDYCG